MSTPPRAHQWHTKPRIFFRILFQGRFHLCKKLFIRVVHNRNALFRAICRAKTATFTQGFTTEGLFARDPDGAIRASLKTETAVVAMGQINVCHNPSASMWPFFIGMEVRMAAPIPFATSS
jgi:hypothetical protein